MGQSYAAPSGTLLDDVASVVSEHACTALATQRVLVEPGLRLAMAGMFVAVLPSLIVLLAPVCVLLLPLLLTLGATLTIPDCATNCYFAKGKVPDNETTSDFIAPGVGSEWNIRPNLNASTKTLRRMLAAHVALGKTVPTTRLAVFGAFVEWETNLLTGLMSGSIDPTKTIFETIKQVAALQNQE